MRGTKEKEWRNTGEKKKKKTIPKNKKQEEERGMLVEGRNDSLALKQVETAAERERSAGGWNERNWGESLQTGCESGSIRVDLPCESARRKQGSWRENMPA